MTCVQAYEFLKARWLAWHPNATPEQIEEAMRAIARKVGL
mgnify:FL=1